MFQDVKVKGVGNYVGDSEVWSIQGWRGEDLIFAMTGFPSLAVAQQAVDYLYAGADRDWNLMAEASKEVIAAGAEALKRAEEEIKGLQFMSKSSRRTYVVKAAHYAMQARQCAEDFRGARS